MKSMPGMLIIRVTASALMLAFIGLTDTLADESESEGGEFKRHAIGVFIGVTHEHHEYLETLGIEYGYFVNKSVEVGAVVERAVREDNSTLAIAFVAFRPYRGWFVGAGVGRKDPGEDRENTLRLSIGYDFEVSHDWSVEPQFHLDIIEGEEDEEVLGVAILRRF